jgi:hypothetical protein
MKNTQKNLIFASFFVFGTLALTGTAFAGIPPTIQTNVQTNVTQTEATLNGYFNTNGSDTTVWFQYGTTPLMTNTTSQVSKAGGTFGNYSVTISVAPGSTVYFRAFGDNTFGPGYGTTFNFKVPEYGNASIQTNPATNTTSGTSATLNGYFNGNGSNISTQFEYGTTNAFGNETSVTYQSALYGNFSETISTSVNTTYYFRAVAINVGGKKSVGQTLSFTTSGSTTTYECSDDIDNDNDGDTDLNDEGCVSGTDNSEDSDGNGGGNNDEPNVTTDSASDVDENSAQLSGNVDANDADVSDCWFEWGEDSDDLDETKDASCDVNENDSEDFDKTISGLDSDTKYYFRACAESTYGEDCGSTKSFTTDEEDGDLSDDIALIPYCADGFDNDFDGFIDMNDIGCSWSGDTDESNIQQIPTYNPNIIYATTGSGVSFVKLSITPVTSTAMRGDQLRYTVSYKNISGRTLSDAILHIQIPLDERFISTTDGLYSSGDHSVIVDLDTLSVGEGGEVSVLVAIANTVRMGDILPIEATLSFTQGSSNSREDASVFATTEISNRNGSNLAAGVLFSGFSFFPNTFWGWLILIALIYVLVLIGTRLYDEKKVK